MKRKVIMAVSVLLTLACLTAVIVSAAGTVNEKTEYEPEIIERVAVESDKVYYAYYNSGSGKGAVAFCFDNEFVSYGDGQENIKICSKNSEGVYEIIHEIKKESVGTWFYGKSEFTVSAPEEVKSLLCGLSGLGVSVESEKVNIAFELSDQPLDKNEQYYVYIPADYFKTEDGLTNEGAYIEIPKDKVNSYTGDLLTDLKTATSGLYDVALFGLESIGGILGR